MQHLISYKLPIFKSLLILFRDVYYRLNGEKNIVLVYSKGKSGTTSVAESLKHHGLKRVYQLHNLNLIIIRNRISIFKKINGRIPSSLINGLFLNLFLNSFLSKKSKIYIITLVRNPIDSAIASYFQNKERFHKLETKNQIIQHLQSTDIGLDEWFDRELIPRFKIDPYKNFNTNEGFSFYNSGINSKVLILKTKMLDSASPIIANFLELEKFDILRYNEAKTKSDYDLYQEIKKELKLSKKTICSVLQERSMIFFTQDEKNSIKAYQGS